MIALIAVPIFSILVVLQSAIVSQVRLLHGTADITLLTLIAWALQKRVDTAWQWGLIGGLLMSLFSALPFGTLLVGYLITTALALFLRQRIWKAPILSMFAITFLGTLVVHSVSIAARWLTGVPLPVIEAYNFITLPSLLLNLLLAVPVYAIVRDIAGWAYPEEVEA